MTRRILIADDHAMFREALRTILPRDEFEIVAEASDGHEAVRQAERNPPDIALVDVAMPGLNGVEATRELLRVAPRCSVVVLTMHRDNGYVAEALRAGASGYVLKTQPIAELIQAMREVARGEVYLSPGSWRAVVDSYQSPEEMEPDPLSGREKQVLQLIAEGHTTKEIGSRLGISVKTAESHREHIMSKLGIHETAGLVRYAIRRGITQP